MFLRHLQDFRIFSRKLSRVSKEALERSSDTNLREKSPRQPKNLNDFNLIVTLDPSKFAEKKQRRLHIGNLRYLLVYISLLKQSSPVIVRPLEYDRTRKTDTQKRPPYPPDTKAFLYYSVSPEKPGIAGELRLRVASSDDPASFESGSDLLMLNGQPWTRPLYALSRFYTLLPLYEKLREERLVSDDLDTALSTLPSSKHHTYNQSRFLYSLNDTFPVDLSSYRVYFVIITEQGVENLRLSALFFDERRSCGSAPYTGTVLARFERSTLPEHKGTRTVVLRCLKIITPVKCVKPLYDGYICCPREGELHRKFYRRHAVRPMPVWSVDIDKSTKADIVPGLRLLLDA